MATQIKEFAILDIQLRTTKLASGAIQAKVQIMNFDKILKQFGMTMQRTHQQVSAFGGGLSTLIASGVISQFGYRVTNTLRRVSSAVVDSTSDLQMAFNRASIFLDGNTQKVREAMMQMEKFAVLTPFELMPSINLQAKMIQLIGESAVKVRGTWESLGAAVPEAARKVKVTVPTMLIWDLCS